MQGYEGGIFHSGYNEVPSKVWIVDRRDERHPCDAGP